MNTVDVIILAVMVALIIAAAVVLRVARIECARANGSWPSASVGRPARGGCATSPSGSTTTPAV